MPERANLIPPLRLSDAGAFAIRPLAAPPRLAGAQAGPRTGAYPADLDARAAAPLDSFHFTTPPRTALPTGPAPSAVTRMVAAAVPGRIDFLADAPPTAPASGPMPMYRHPADRNAAATAVSAGRVLDVEG